MNLVLDNLTKNFAEQSVIKSVNLELSDVHSIVILGPSGGGKTTLLRMIAGLEPPTAGTITINGTTIPYSSNQPFDRNPALRMYRTSISIVFQSFNLLPHLTALQNIMLPLVKVHKIDKDEAEHRSIELLERFRLKGHAHKKPHKLSGGQKQRIAISRSMASNPDILLFDEPTSALDPEFIAEVLDMISELGSSRDIIIITHHIGFAKRVSDYALFVGDATVLDHGTPEYLFEQATHHTVRRFFHTILDY